MKMIASQLIITVVAALAADRLDTFAWSVRSLPSAKYGGRTFPLRIAGSFKYRKIEPDNARVQCPHLKNWRSLHGNLVSLYMSESKMCAVEVAEEL